VVVILFLKRIKLIVGIRNGGESAVMGSRKANLQRFLAIAARGDGDITVVDFSTPFHELQVLIWLLSFLFNLEAKLIASTIPLITI